MAIIFPMDESLKARLIGAAVLVAVAVILIPELLTGRGPAHSTAPVSGDRGTRTIVIDVPVSGAATSEPAPAPAPAPAVAEGGPVARDPVSASGQLAAGSQAEQPAPAPTSTATPAAAVVETRPGPAPSAAAPAAAPAVSEPVSAPATTATVAQPGPPPAATTRGAWAVQVGAFGSTAAAGKVVNELGSAGFRAYVSPVQRGGKTLYRVRVGPEAERSRADALAVTLKGRGLPATVVAND